MAFVTSVVVVGATVVAVVVVVKVIGVAVAVVVAVVEVVVCMVEKALVLEVRVSAPVFVMGGVVFV